MFSHKELKQSDSISAFYILNSASFHSSTCFKFDFSDFSCVSAFDEGQNQKEKQAVYNAASELSQLQTIWFEKGQKLYGDQVAN